MLPTTVPRHVTHISSFYPVFYTCRIHTSVRWGPARTGDQTSNLVDQPSLSHSRSQMQCHKGKVGNKSHFLITNVDVERDTGCSLRPWVATRNTHIVLCLKSHVRHVASHQHQNGHCFVSHGKHSLINCITLKNGSRCGGITNISFWFNLSLEGRQLSDGKLYIFCTHYLTEGLNWPSQGWVGFD